MVSLHEAETVPSFKFVSLFTARCKFKQSIYHCLALPTRRVLDWPQSYSQAHPLPHVDLIVAIDDVKLGCFAVEAAPLGLITGDPTGTCLALWFGDTAEERVWTSSMGIDGKSGALEETRRDATVHLRSTHD